jgi:hypothetical protein
MSISYPLPQKGYPLPGRNSGEGLTKQYCYVVPLATAKDYIPSDNSQDPNNEAGYIFSSASFSSHEDPTLLYMYVNYKANSNSQTVTSGQREVGSIVKRASLAVQAKPIEEHKAWSDPDFQAAAKEKKREIFLVAGITYTYSQTYSGSSFGISESVLVNGLGQKGAPTGLIGANGDKWMRTGTEIVQEGNNVNVDITWQYSEAGWPFDFNHDENGNPT